MTSLLQNLSSAFEMFSGVSRPEVLIDVENISLLNVV